MSETGVREPENMSSVDKVRQVVGALAITATVALGVSTVFEADTAGISGAPTSPQLQTERVYDAPANPEGVSTQDGAIGILTILAGSTYLLFRRPRQQRQDDR